MSPRSKSIFHICALFALLVSALGSAVTVTPAYAASLVVNTTADDMTGGNGYCTLREAINNANSNSGDTTSGDCVAGSGADTISFDSSLSGGTITLGSALPDIVSDMDIDGSSLASQVTISGNSIYRVFKINSGTVTLNSLIMANGYMSSSGGSGINNSGTLTVTNSTVSGNSTANYGGGGIYNTGTLTVTNSTVSGNSTSNYGAGIANNGGTLTVTHSTISGNNAGGNGGGIYNKGVLTVTDSTLSGNNGDNFAGGLFNDIGTATVSNSTISGNNTIYNEGGGIYNIGTLTLTNSTVAGNTAQTGGVYNNGTLTLLNDTISGNTALDTSRAGVGLFNAGTASITNTIIANSMGNSADCNNGGGISTNTNNLVENITDSSCGTIGGDPNLGALADNGGSTQTMALLSGSSAIDAGDTGSCPATDQRGADRPLGSGCDIGAYESTLEVGPAFIVNVDEDTDDGSCDYYVVSPSKDCTLREAINAANAHSGADTITFASSLSGGTITLGSALSDIAGDVDIDGSSLAAQITVSGNNLYRVFKVNSGTVTLDSLIIANGSGSPGGGIYNSGVLTVTNCTFSNNSSAGVGGGIDNYGGTLTVTDNTFSGNSATGVGGGIYSYNGTLTVTNSTFSGNHTDYNGGGIFSDINMTTTVTNSTFSGNSATTYGGGILNVESVTVNNSTFSGNSAGSGGGIYNALGANLNYVNTIIANSTSGGDCVNDGTLGTNANNLVEDGSCSSSLSGAPILGPLADNGGPTQTMALQTGSPAIDAGDDPTCAASPVSGLDQRGVVRPQGAHCDIGAFEAPAQFVPTDGSTLSYNRAAFDWPDFAGASSYNIQVSRNSAFSLLVINAAVVPSAFTPGTSLPPNTKLYWRVRAKVGGSYSAWSVIRSFTTANPPSVPVLGSPANNALTTNYIPTLDWANSTIPSGTAFDHYQVQVDDNSDFSSAFDDYSTTSGDITASSHVVPALTPNTKYFWRVRSFNTLGQYSAWSTVFAVRAAMIPPVLNNPADTSALLNRRPTFDWIAVTGASGYNIQVSKNSTFSLLVLNTTSSGAMFTPSVDLPGGMKLYWRVRATGANGPSLWSVTYSFTAGNPPSTPVLSAPGNNALTIDYTPLLDWANSTLPLGTTFDHYQIQVDDNYDFSSTVMDGTTTLNDITDSDYTPGSDLVPNTKYYWHVRSFNTAGEYSAWSAVRAFRTALLPPTLNNPADTAVLLNKRPTFDWNTVTGATSYNIQVSRNSAFSLLVLNTNSATTTYTPATDLPANSLLYWRVRSNGTNGPSAWSVMRSFTSGNPPTTPVLSAPANNALTTTYTPLLDWGNSTLPLGTSFDHYQVQADDNSDFSSPVVDANTAIGNISASSYTPAPLADNTKFYWRVRAFNSTGEYSAWSAVRYFRTRLLAPTLSAPTNGATGVGLKPNFAWNDVSGATSYTIQIAKNSTFGTIVMTVTVSPSTFTPGTNLPAGITLYWRVRANGANGPSAWSAFYSFSTP